MYNIKSLFSLKWECIRSLSGSSPSSRAFAVLLLGVRLSQRFTMRHTAVNFIALVFFLLSFCIHLHTKKWHDNWSLSEDSKEATVGRDMASNPCRVISLERFIPIGSMVLADSPIIYHKNQPSTIHVGQKTVRPMGIPHGDLPGRAVWIVTSRLSTALVLAIIALICLPEKEGCCLPGVVGGWVSPDVVFIDERLKKRCFPWFILRILYLFGESWTCGWWDQLQGWWFGRPFGMIRISRMLLIPRWVTLSWLEAGHQERKSAAFSLLTLLRVGTLWSPEIVSIINQKDWYKMSQAPWFPK